MATRTFVEPLAETQATVLTVTHVGDHAQGKRGAAHQHLVRVNAVDVLAAHDWPVNLVVIAAAADNVGQLLPARLDSERIGALAEAIRFDIA